MRISQIIGTVTLSQLHPSFRGSRLKLAVPLSLNDLIGKTQPAAGSIVVWDDLGAAMGDRIAMAEGPEASQPFRPERKPVDAYNVAILDHLNIRLGDQT